MTAVPGVPVEAIEAAARAIYDHDWVSDKDPKWDDVDRGVRLLYVESARRGLAAALPSLREVIAAEALAPIRQAPEEWEALRSDEAHWSHDLDTYVYRESDVQPIFDAIRAALSAPAQAAEEVGGDDD